MIKKESSLITHPETQKRESLSHDFHFILFLHYPMKSPPGRYSNIPSESYLSTMRTSRPKSPPVDLPICYLPFRPSQSLLLFSLCFSPVLAEATPLPPSLPLSRVKESARNRPLFRGGGNVFWKETIAFICVRPCRSFLLPV